jgi:hypothetical protein
MTGKDIVFKMLKSRRWISGEALEAEAGAGALRRVREFRAEGYDIRKRRTSSGSYEYRMTKATLVF